MERSFEEVIHLYRDQNELNHNEGRRGVESLCKLVNALGYKDRQYMGQFNGGSLGDLIEFLEDNSGAVDAVVEWIGNQKVPEWKENLEFEIEPDEDEDDEDLDDEE